MDRREELEEAILCRVRAIFPQAADPGARWDAEQTRSALRAAVDAALVSLRQVDGGGPIPPEILDQARLAARSRVDLATVLRQWFVGYGLLCEFLIEELEECGPPQDIGRSDLLRIQRQHFDNLVSAVVDAYAQEHRRPAMPDHRRTELVQRLLAGEIADASQLAYDLDGHHIAVIAQGPKANTSVKQLQVLLDSSALVVRQADEAIWAWLGLREPLAPSRLETLASTATPSDVALALGEPHYGLRGWRRSYEQASAAFLVAQRRRGRAVRYADVALIASMLNDDLLARSLQDLYVTPLGEERDGGAVLRETLRVYFSRGRNGASTAAALNVSRQTVTNRLKTVEERIGRPLTQCATALEAALDYAVLAENDTSSVNR